MAANFSIGKVFVAGYHGTKDRRVHFHPFKFKNLSKGFHKEQEEDRHHVVPLTYSHVLQDLFDLVRTPPPPICRHHQIAVSGRDP